MASGMDVVFIPAGAPPLTSSFAYAATHYGQDGLGLVLAEAMGESSVKQEELTDRIDELALQFTDPTASLQPEDEGVGGMEDEGVEQVEEEVEELIEELIAEQIQQQIQQQFEELVGEEDEGEGGW